MPAEEIAAAGTQATWEAELEQSRLSSRRLLDLLARKLRAVRTGQAPMPRPVFAMAAAVAAGFLIGCLLKRSSR